MRAFVAIDVPDPRAPTEPAASAHLTLKFLGEIPPEVVEPLGTALRPAVASHPPFSVELRGVGAFPAPGDPRVVWAGVGEGAPGVVSLASLVEEAAVSVGIRREPRPFQPHVTILRVRGARDLDRARIWLAHGPDHAFGRADVAEVVLYASELRREGAVHRAVERYPLRGERPG
jgi:2'-5' RNA ligase